MTDYARARYERDQRMAIDAGLDESARQDAANRLLFWTVRFKPVRHADQLADTFLAMWSDLMLTASRTGWAMPMKQIHRMLDKFFNNPELAAAMAQAGDQARDCLIAELDDAIDIYFSSCKQDNNYTSVLFQMIRMKEDQVAAKAAGSAGQDLLRPLAMLDDFTWRDDMIRSVCRAYSSNFPNQLELLENQIDQLKPERSAIIRRARQQDQILE